MSGFVLFIIVVVAICSFMVGWSAYQQGETPRSAILVGVFGGPVTAIGLVIVMGVLGMIIEGQALYSEHLSNCKKESTSIYEYERCVRR